MTYAELIQKFLAMVAKIKSLNPSYKQPGDGSDGTCDCIGLIIGAIRRMGLTWKGIHGSNYAARYQVAGLRKITDVSQMQLGDVMLKAYEQGHSKWNLPKRYWKGNQYYTGDMRDYYHAGTVTSLNPVVITHMTSPHMKTLTIKSMNDLTKNNWLYHGKAKPIVNASSDKPDTSSYAPASSPSSGSKAKVTAKSGSTVNLRQKPSKSAKILVRVPIGTTVTITEPGEAWAAVTYGNYRGYMMAEFLEVA